MKFSLLTLFPGLVEGYFSTSVMAKAVERGLVSYEIVDIRDFAQDSHRSCDDYCYGGGPGMVMKPEPIARAFDSMPLQESWVVYPSPSGKSFTQAKAVELSRKDSVVLLCGRYEGVDQRVIDHYIDEELTIGDYVISSGEVAALVIVDAVYRLLDGVINHHSLEEESYERGILEYPHYTRPSEFRGMVVPEVLISGHHEKIRRWRVQKGVEKTLRNRPELLERARRDPEVADILSELEKH